MAARSIFYLLLSILSLIVAPTAAAQDATQCISVDKENGEIWNNCADEITAFYCIGGTCGGTKYYKRFSAIDGKSSVPILGWTGGKRLEYGGCEGAFSSKHTSGKDFECLRADGTFVSVEAKPNIQQASHKQKNEFACDSLSPRLSSSLPKNTKKTVQITAVGEKGPTFFNIAGKDTSIQLNLYKEMKRIDKLYAQGIVGSMSDNASEGAAELVALEQRVTRKVSEALIDVCYGSLSDDEPETFSIKNVVQLIKEALRNEQFNGHSGGRISYMGVRG